MDSQSRDNNAYPSELQFTKAEEVAAFETQLDQYLEQRGVVPFHWVSLPDAWQFLLKHEAGSKAFALLMEVYLGAAALQQELKEIVEVLNEEIRGDQEPDSHFAARMHLHRVNSAYILRYRAVLDKIMSFIVLTAEPAEHKKFESAKSRKKRFLRICSESKRVSTTIGQYFGTLTTAFDSRYRTGEAHGGGSLRKWNFSDITSQGHPQEDMVWAWNSLHPLLTMIGKVATNQSAANRASET